MNADKLTIAFGYLRLSREEAKQGESSSIKTQRSMISDYCSNHNINLVKFFVDDGWSGGNFDRPGFQDMMRELENGVINTVITKDLSRLGRDMRESSYYAEQFFPEHGIRFLTISDNFDTEQDNIMAPFQFAMNEVYLRDGSRKVKEALRNKRENGQYCSCPPYGYKKEPGNKAHLIPDEATAPVVQKIFALYADGYSCNRIASHLNERGVIPPLKYRVLYRDEFGESGASRASDYWNGTTVKRILKNPVYLGHTLLGKSRKPSLKSKKVLPVPRSLWAVTENTHEPLVGEETFARAHGQMRRGTKIYEGYGQVRKSIFSGVAFCALCGYALCSAGTVYKGEREKYWFLTCNHTRKTLPDPCPGIRVRYEDLVELVRQELNSFLTMSDEEIDELTNELVDQKRLQSTIQKRKLQKEKAEARYSTIGRLITKLYTDNAEGRLDDAQLYPMVAELQREAHGLERLIAELDTATDEDRRAEDYRKFFSLIKRFTEIKTLDANTLRTFVDRIEVGPKELPKGTEKVTHRNQPYRQKIRIFYKFVGELEDDSTREMPVKTAAEHKKGGSDEKA